MSGWKLAAISAPIREGTRTLFRTPACISLSLVNSTRIVTEAMARDRE